MIMLFFSNLGSIALLLNEFFFGIFKKPFYWKLLIDQIYHIGVRSLLLVIVTGLATGSVMALQFGYGLEKFGGKLYIPKVVSLSILREMGPVFTSLLVAGRVSSGIAAEIASMNVTQQIDAIRALGTSPIQRIVVPRILACMIALPLLTTVADIVGIGSALVVSHFELNVYADFFLTKALETVKVNDYIAGTGKTIFFGLFMGLISCWRGLKTTGGTRGVGESTTWSVLVASVTIMISDYFLTKLFMFLVLGNE